MLLFAATAWGATWTVGASGDFPTLSAAVAGASRGDTLELASGSWAEAVSVSKDLTVRGAGAESTFLDGTGLGTRPLTVQNANVTLEALTVTGGDDESGGAVHLSGGSLTTSEVVFADNSATTGGAIYASNAALVLLDTTLSDNVATDGGAVALTGGSSLEASGGAWTDNDAYEDGGVVWISASSVLGEGLTVTGNRTTAGYGGAVYLEGAEATAAFVDSELSENVAYRYGGAIYAANLYGTVSLEGCTLADNEATYGHGGAVYLYNRSDLVASDTHFEGNFAYYAGGGVYQYYLSTATVTDCRFEGNESSTYPGGGFYTIVYTNEADPTAFTRTAFVGNEAYQEGGGIYAYYAYLLRIDACRFERNAAGSSSAGGGLFAETTYELDVGGSHFVGNSARYGGGAYLDKVAGEQPWVVHNTVFQENEAEVGGGLCVSQNENTGVVDLVNNAWVGNRAEREAAALCVSEARPTVRNSVFAYHPGGAAVGVYDVNSAAYAEFHHDVFWENADGDWVGEDVATGEGMLAVAPDFGAYSRDGDPDNDSFVLAAGSALVDAGDPTLTDPDGSVSDIGPMGGSEASQRDDDGDGLAAWLDCDDQDADVGAACPEEEEEAPEDTGGADTGDAPLDTGGGRDSGDIAAAAPGDAEGCGCAAGSGVVLWWLLAPVLVRRRR